MFDGSEARRHVGDDQRDADGAETSRAPIVECLNLRDERTHSAKAGPDNNSGACGGRIIFLIGDTGLCQGLTNGNQEELRVSIEPTHLTGLAPTPRVPSARGELSSDEEARIRQALADHDGNIELATQTLGMSRATLYRKLKKMRKD